ncbi:MAG: hypothetical protein IT210_04030 [Armatimonadetes bacterium]|nr:hypothetical protein [Armatimonadota bacterium]
MMKRQVSPKAVAVTILVMLGAVQLLYWRLLVYTPPGKPMEMKGGGMMGKSVVAHFGLKDSPVETWAGNPTPGFQDGRGRRAAFDGPAAIALGPDRCIYVADSRNHRIRKVAPDGDVSTVAGSGPVDSLNPGFADGPVQESRFRFPAGVVAAPNGDIFVADTGNHRIRLIRGGQVYTYAGSDTPRDEDGSPGGGFADGPGESARFSSPASLALDKSGNLYVADIGNRAIRKITRGRVVSTAFRGEPLEVPASLHVRGDGSLLIADPGKGMLYSLTGNSLQPAALGEIIWEGYLYDTTGLGQFRVKQPAALAETSDGLLFLADTHWHALFFLSPERKAFLVAGTVSAESPSSGYYDGNGEKALFLNPVSLAPGPQGTVYISDFGNNCIRKFTLNASAGDLLTPPPSPVGKSPQWIQDYSQRQRQQRAGERPSPPDANGKEQRP